jgi:hypothetical protein
MQLELKNFADAGVLDKERLIIRVLADVNIGSYVVLRSKTNDNGRPISGTKDAYWFPDVEVRRGDLIVLYTKRGTSSKKALEGSSGMAHFYYWSQSSPFWGAERSNTAVLIYADSWASKSP